MAGVESFHDPDRAQLFAPSIARLGAVNDDDAVTVAPFKERATFVLMSGVGEGTGVGVGVGLGATVGVGDGWVDVPALQASSSTIRLKPSDAELITTRILDVVIGEKVNLRITMLLPLTLPPETLAQAEPVQYWTLKLTRPYAVETVDVEGSAVFR